MVYNITNWFDSELQYENIDWDDPKSLHEAMRQAVRDNPGKRDVDVALKMTNKFIDNGYYERESEGIRDYFKAKAQTLSLEELQGIKKAQGSFIAIGEIEDAIKTKTEAQEESIQRTTRLSKYALEKQSQSDNSEISSAATREISRRQSQINSLQSSMEAVSRTGETTDGRYYGQVPKSNPSLGTLELAYGYSNEEARRVSSIIKELRAIDKDWANY